MKKLRRLLQGAGPSSILGHCCLLRQVFLSMKKAIAKRRALVSLETLLFAEANVSFKKIE